MKKGIILFISAFLATACNPSSSSNYNPKDTPEVIAKQNFTSILEALTHIKTNRNLRLDIMTTGYSGTIEFTRDLYVYNQSYGYKEDNYGVFSFDFYQDRIVTSEYLKDQFDNPVTDYRQLVYSFSDFNLEKFSNATTSEFSLVDKSSILTLMEIIGIDLILYTEFNQCDIILENNNIINIDLLFGSFNLSLSISNIQETVIEFSQDIPGVFLPDTQISKIKNLFSGNNFTRDVYLEDELVAQEIFNPQYFYAYCYNDQYWLENLSYCNIGYIGLENKSDGVNTYNGAYKFDLITGLDILRIPVDSQTDMTIFLNYPSRLAAFNYLQYFEYLEDRSSYWTIQPYLVEDFIYNFGYSIYFTSVANGGYGFSYTGLEIEFDLTDEDALSTITFNLFALTSYGEVYFEFIFTNFNNSWIDRLENFLETLS